ncbi:glutamate--tRNA ligase [Candidatus Micrarchaeota archaeon]|nr:glutamate--tRNA ligase [Candidatus Micrarchaeota archaeon]
MEKEAEKIIRKHVLKNAYDYGSANAGSVVGKVIAECPEIKKDMKTAMKKINETVKEINKMEKEEIEKELENYTFKEKKKEEKGLVLPNAEKGKVVTRFPPEPSGYPHIGHAKAAFLDYESAKTYNGKMVLRFDDTNPEKAELEFVDAIKEGLKWLGIKWSRETYSSDYMEEFYKYCEKMIKQGNLYVCTCKGDKIKENRQKKKECACRKLPEEEHLNRWNNMLSGKYKKGEAVVRYKGDMKSQNTVMRDPAMLRIIAHRHYRQGNKYTVWPAYDFAAPILDSIEGITHAMRTKEYELRNPLFFAVLDALKLRKPELIEFSRLAIKNSPIQKRVIRPLVEEGKVDGWDDPRLPTLKGLKRRGIMPEAVKNFVLRFGLSKVESEPNWDILLKENRKILNDIAEKYFFVPSPAELKLKGKGRIYIPGDDFKTLKKGEIFRLKDFKSVKYLGNKEIGYADTDEGKVVQWTAENSVKCRVAVVGDLLKDDKYNPDSLRYVEGLCEQSCLELKEGIIIQFERFGFCRLDKKSEKKMEFIFSS